MNLHDDVFDEMIRQKIGQRDFGSPSAGWQKAEKMIDEAMPANSASSSVRLGTAILLMLFTGLTGACVMYFSLSGDKYAGTKITRIEPAPVLYSPATGTQTSVAATVSSGNNSPAISSGYSLIVGSSPREISSDRVNQNNGTQNNFADNEASVNANNAQDEEIYSDPARVNAENAPADVQDVLTAVETFVSTEKDAVDSVLTPVVPGNDDIAVNEMPLQNDSVPSLGGQSTSVNFWFLQAGAGYSAAFSRAGQSGKSINPVFGGGYNVWLSPRVNLQAGLRYTFIDNASDTASTTLTGTSGSIHQYNETRLQRLHYFSLPLQIYWRFSGRHSLTGGYALNYLAAAENRERSYTENNGVINTNRKRSVFGREQGLNRFDGMFMAGYAFAFNAHFSAEAMCYTGLTDIKNNGWYGVNRFERNRGFMLLVQYSF